MKSFLDFYSINNFYKGRVMKTFDDGRIVAEIPDIILSKPSPDELIENISSNNISNSNELSLENSIKSINGIICKPLFINGDLVQPNIGDTVFIIFFDKDPKKIFYINITNDFPKPRRKKNYEIVEKDDELLVKYGENSILINEDRIELKGNVIVNGNKI